jgi:uncharacterized protein
VPSTVAVDTGPLVALFDRSEARHADAVRFFSGLKDRCFVTVAVVTEVMYLLSDVGDAALDFLYCLRIGDFVIVDLDSTDWIRVEALMRKYRDTPMDFADATIVTICERIGTKFVATMDSHFTIYRRYDRHLFVNIFPE